MRIMDEEVWDHIGYTGVETLQEFGYVVVKKDDVDQLEKKYQSALEVNRNHSIRYSKLLDNVQRMAMGLEHPMGEILDTLIKQKRLIDELRSNVVDLWRASDQTHVGPLWSRMKLTHEESKLWLKQPSGKEKENEEEKVESEKAP